MKNRDGFVANELVRREWKDWCASNNVRIHVADNQLISRLTAESSWDLSKVRKGGDGMRAVQGLSLRKDQDDEV